MPSFKRINSQHGYTITELLLVISIFAILSSFVVINLIKPQTSTSIISAVNLLSADLKSQQIKSISGFTDGGALEPFGIYFENNRYILFKGSNYNAGNTTNFIVNLQSNTQIENITFSGSQVVFARRSGEVTPGPGSLVIRNPQTNEQKTLNINIYGVISIE